MAGHSLETCLRAWRRRDPLINGGDNESLADQQFALGNFRAAADAYAAGESQNDDVKAKRGWCLAALEQFDEAEQLLTPTTCGTSSAGLAMLAVIQAGGWTRKKLQASGTNGDEIKARSEQVSQLVQGALEAQGEPDYLAFLAYKDLTEWWRNREAALVVAERGVKLFRSPTLLEWHAMLLRTLGRPAHSALDALLTQIPADPEPSYVREVFESGLSLSRYDDAAAALDIFDEKLRSEQDSRFSMALKLLRAYVELRRALDADPGTATRALANVESVSRDLGASNSESVANDWLRMFHHKLRLALAVVVKDEGAMRESATAIIDSSWCADYEPEHSPAFEMVWLYGFEHEAYFGHGYLEPAVTTSLSSENQIRWTLLLALQDLEHEGNSDSKAAEVISAHGGRAPPWAAGTVASILLDSKDSDLYSAGLVLARYCLHIERTEERYAKPPAWNYEHLSTAQLGELIEGIVGEFSDARANATSSGGLLLEELGDILYAKKAYHDLRRLSDLILTRAPEHLGALFYSALSRQELKQLSAAKPLYERLLKLDTGHRSAYWNLTLILETQGNVDAIEDMLPALEEHARDGAERWIKARDLARAALGRLRQHNAKTDLRSFVRRELATYPALREEPIDGNELSLLEAASLVALLRAADIDHSAWTLGSFDSSSIPFEPTDRFRSALLDLARKGIIRIAESTPPNAFTARDGQLCYYLGQVQWSISPYTLALQGNIRDMARGNWPTHWTAHVEVLSRDLATEECVAYMEYLAEQRGLDPPDRTDSRALFRELLEHCSVGKCWYYIYTGVQSANDYRTKYPVSRAQVSAMMLRRTRERGENAIAKGWDTQYSRIRALPRSHLSAGLHDVLTGWGERAFEEPIRMLNQP